jgi:hypothetical protein
MNEIRLIDPVSNAAFLVRGFSHKLEFFADLLYTVFHLSCLIMKGRAKGQSTVLCVDGLKRHAKRGQNSLEYIATDFSCMVRTACNSSGITVNSKFF